jgi:nitrite reductase (NO-forming)
VVGAVLAHVASLVAMARSSPLAGPLPIVTWYYVAAGAALAVGGTLGGVLAAGPERSSGLDAALVLAHAQVNLLGWLGLTAARAGISKPGQARATSPPTATGGPRTRGPRG